MYRDSMVFAIAFLIVLAGMRVASAEGDPSGQHNRAPDSDLPQGEGLAAAWSGDIGAHPDVIFSENFEQGDFRRRWREVRDAGGVLEVVSLENDGSPVGKNSLRVKATLGKNTGGGMTTWFESADRVFIRFYVRFDPDCDYIHHFCTLRANKAIRGGDAWTGFGGAGSLPQGDERFSTALEPWGNWGRFPAPGKWNYYSYWHEMSSSPDGKYWGNAFRPASQPVIKKGRWICAEMMLKHNSPGKRDGEQAYWIDGELRGHWTGISWRKSPDLWANAFSLESYVTDRWTKNPVNIVYFDNVVIAKKYVGPALP